VKASYNWIRELVPGLRATPEELAARFTAAGLAVDGLRAYGAGIEPCLVAKVVGVRPHPSRSGLRLVTVDAGPSRAAQEVVCGAPNVPEPGGLVVLAPLGTHLPAKGMTIEARPIGGVTSEGMLCSESELGLTDESDGIIVLPPSAAPPGARFVDAAPAAQDTIFEIDLTPNRPDGLGHVGLAREAAALLGILWGPPGPAEPPRVHAEGIEQLARVVVEDGERCPHYAVGAVLDVTVAPSPDAIRYRLASLGVRSISNLVDVTNLVMLEFGHPLHAFDLDRVRDQTIVVRRARAGERLTTLDGVERALTEDDLLICDGRGPVGLAGVMGGENSEIGPTTRRVLLECAYFDARGVRRTSRRHGLHTEASHRFERGVDHGDTSLALSRAVALTAELGGGAAAWGLRHVDAKTIERAQVRVRRARVNQLLGVDVPRAEMTTVLTALGFELTDLQDDAFEMRVPSHRPDVTREVDVIDEIARVRGLDAIPTVLPAMRARVDVGGREALSRRVREAAVGLGLSEAITYAFVSPRDLEQVSAPPAAVVLKNPLTEDRSVMRTSLLPGLLQCAARAARHGERSARLFHVGTIFLPPHPSRSASPGLPEERLGFAAIVTGERPAYLAKPEPVDVWDAKAIAQGMLARLGYAAFAVRPAADAERARHLHPRGAAAVSIAGVDVGWFGPLHPDVAEAAGVEGACVSIEIDVAALAVLPPPKARFRPIPRFPASPRDVALVVSARVLAGDVERAVREAAGDLGEDVRLFDRFTGGAIPAGHVSLAFRVVYRAEGRTLTDAEVDAQHAKVVAEVQSRFGATLRA